LSAVNGTEVVASFRLSAFSYLIEEVGESDGGEYTDDDNDN